MADPLRITRPGLTAGAFVYLEAPVACGHDPKLAHMIDLSLNGRWQHMIDTTNNQTRIRMAASAMAAAGLIGEADARLILDQVVAARRDGISTTDIMRLLTYRPKAPR